VLPLRNVMKMYLAQRERAQAGDRVMRESTTMHGAESVWSDVASSKGMGFRAGDAGPLLYGDLASGGEIEMALFTTDYSEVYCTVATVRGREERARQGEVSVRPHAIATRLLRVIVAQPELPAELLARYFFRGRPPELAAHLFGGERAQAMLLEQVDRAPRFFFEAGSSTLVLEGVELVHERLERLVDALSEIDARGHDRGS
jgi:hypothetical protein